MTHEAPPIAEQTPVTVLTCTSVRARIPAS